MRQGSIESDPQIAHTNPHLSGQRDVNEASDQIKSIWRFVPKRIDAKMPTGLARKRSLRKTHPCLELVFFCTARGPGCTGLGVRDAGRADGDLRS